MNGSTPPFLLENGETVALASAARQVRVEAAPHFERLIIELSNKVRQFL